MLQAVQMETLRFLAVALVIALLAALVVLVLPGLLQPALGVFSLPAGTAQLPSA